MKNIQISRPVSKVSYYFALLLISCTLMVACNKEDDMDDDMPDPDYPVSYVSFSIMGPIIDQSFEYKDASVEDEFTSLGALYKKADDPELSEDQIQIYLGKSFSKSNFLLVAPPQKGSLNITYLNTTSDFDVRIQLESIEEGYYAKEVAVNITDLEINGNTITHCKGTFAGEFYRNNLVEADVHQINGNFEIN